jgi:hypothetical protein
MSYDPAACSAHRDGCCAQVLPHVCECDSVHVLLVTYVTELQSCRGVVPCHLHAVACQGPTGRDNKVVGDGCTVAAGASRHTCADSMSVRVQHVRHVVVLCCAVLCVAQLHIVSAAAVTPA